MVQQREMAQQHGRALIEAGIIQFIVQHEGWDGNLQDHSDQGIAILVVGQVDGKETTLLRFNCFDVERSYIYGPEGKNKLRRMDPIVDGNPIAWTMKQLRHNLAKMIIEAGYESIAHQVDTEIVGEKLDEVESTARELFATGRHTVKHNRGTDIFEAGNIRFGLEMRGRDPATGGLAIHVLTDVGGTPSDEYTEETELLALDHFRVNPHYHYGPRNKNHRIMWDTTVVPDPLEWTLQQFKDGKLAAMIEHAGYPGVAADLDGGLIASVIPALEARAREMQPKENP